MEALTVASPARSRTAHLEVRGVARTVGATTILHPVGFTADRGEVVAIAGGSGAGKSTLLDVIAGRHRPDEGTLRLDGRAPDPASGAPHCGYVPQDDIVHADLPLGRCLDHTAALRLDGVDRHVRREAVRRVVDQVGLTAHVDTRVGSLSGGQRKRTCIAAELLVEPELLLLDEPTSGLDPATAADLMGQLRRLAARGATVVMTTHSPADLARCDRVVLLAPGGRHVFTGPPAEALEAFGVDRLDEVYELLGDAPTLPSVEDEHRRPVPRRVRRPRPTGWWRQWRTVTSRSSELLVRNPLTMAILFGSPVAVIAMLATLFRPGTLDVTRPAGAAQLVFWIVFSAFFFGMTYGLLQVVTERAVVDRERAAGLHVTAYVAAKMTVLLPFLAVVDAVMLWVLQLSGLLPRTSTSDMIAMWATLAVTSAAALGVGLATSALVRTAAQATLALPMLCFPQVLFAGAIVPVPEMALPGRLLSSILVGRWGFEAFGRTSAAGRSPGRWPDVGVTSAFSGSPSIGVSVLIAIAGVATTVTIRALRR